MVVLILTRQGPAVPVIPAPEALPVIGAKWYVLMLGVAWRVADAVLMQISVKVETVVDAGVISPANQISQSPAVKEIPAASTGVLLAKATLAVPVWVPDCEPVVVIKVPAMALSTVVDILKLPFGTVVGDV